MDKQVVILRMPDGVEILATVVENAGSYFCRDIIQIITDVDERGQGRMGFMEFMPYADKEAGFAVPSSIASIAFPSKELLDHYNERFGKIITPSTKLKLV